MVKHLHFYFFPLMTPGHMMPLVDMARQFARHDSTVKSTIVLPHLNAPQFQAAIDGDRQLGFDVEIRQVRFPTAQVGLPEDFLGLTSITAPHMFMQFEEAIQLLREPVEQFLEQDRPNCIVADFFVSWAGDLAAKLNIPRIIFHVAGFFPLCVYHSFFKHRLCGISAEEFVVPGLPDVVTMKPRQLSDNLRAKEKPPAGIADIMREAEEACFGVVFNSFKELEKDYVEYYRANIRPKAWHVGPVSLCTRKNKIKEHYCLDWLNTKEPHSVVYLCFGTLSLFSAAQLREIAVGLETCGRNFIWVVNRKEGDLLPEGFEERMTQSAAGNKGLVIKSWAPQVPILEHEAVGGFLNHCGWNTLLEGVVAGKPMITWPISYEQFETEKLVTEILKIGVSVGNEEWAPRLNSGQRSLVKWESIAKAVNKVMVGEEGLEMRNKVEALSREAKHAIEKAGSSYNDLDSLMEELRSIQNA